MDAGHFGRDGHQRFRRAAPGDDRRCGVTKRVGKSSSQPSTAASTRCSPTFSCSSRRAACSGVSSPSAYPRVAPTGRDGCACQLRAASAAPRRVLQACGAGGDRRSSGTPRTWRRHHGGCLTRDSAQAHEGSQTCDALAFGAKSNAWSEKKAHFWICCLGSTRYWASPGASCAAHGDSTAGYRRMPRRKSRRGSSRSWRRPPTLPALKSYLKKCYH